MVDIMRGVIGATSSYVLGWVMPLAFATLTFVFLVLRPAGVAIDDALLSGDAALALVAFGIAMVAGGLILSALATPIYRVLEGYSWPRSLRTAGVRRQAARKARLQRKLEAATSDTERSLVAEQLDRFPIDQDQLTPTRLGNAMRAFETFGVDRYRLDSQALWVELTTVAPEHLRDEIGRARGAVDFFVAQVFLTWLFAIGSGVVWLKAPGERRWALLATLVSAALLPIFYRGAVSSTTYWSNTVRALVNVGRPALATSLGLRLPATLADERLMWERVAALNYYPFDESWITLLDQFRVAPNEDGPDEDTPERATPGPGSA